MKRLITSLAAALVAAGAFAAQAVPTAAPASATAPTYYYWLHPKLGMVKVDRATNAIVTAKRAPPSTRQLGGPPAPAN